MIVTVVSEGGHAAKDALAERLAVLRGTRGRKVLLMDADPCHLHGNGHVTARAISGKGVQAELENLGQRYQDIVVDAANRDSLGSRAALIGANVVVVPADGLDGDGPAAARLAERIGNARLFNPGMRIVIVPAGAGAVGDFLCRSLPAARLLEEGGDESLYAAVFPA